MLTEEAAFPLKNWFSQLNDEDRNIIETEIFNFNGEIIPMEVAFEHITDQNSARGVMTRFRGYLEARKNGTQLAELKVDAKEIAQLMARMVERTQ